MRKGSCARVAVRDVVSSLPTGRAWPFAVALALCIAGLSAPEPARAQESTTEASPELAAVDSLIARSRFRDAAAALDRWDRANVATITPQHRATALLLRARLAQDADTVRDLYLSLSLGYPSSPEAAVALLRLGQLAVAQNDAARATSYFQRIATDHPSSPARAEASLWLDRLRPAVDAAQRPSTTQPPSTAQRQSVDSDARYALQVGAFRAAGTAQTVVRQLAKAGFDARAVRVPANQLVRVRIGRFATSRAADETMRRLRAAGFEAIVVDDARAETVAQD